MTTVEVNAETPSAVAHVPLERERELATIAAALDEAERGRGQALLLEGPAGIGKSLLVDEATDRARHTFQILSGRGGELERGHPFGVVLQAFDAMQDMSFVRGRARLAKPLLAPAQETGLTAASDEADLLEGLHWCVVNLCNDGPVAVVIDDLHWADELSARFVAALSGRIAQLPVVLVVAYRPTEMGDHLGVLRRLRRQASVPPLQPSPLSRKAVAQILRASETPLPIDDDVAKAAWESTRGNAFLVHELASSIRDLPNLGALDVDTVRGIAPDAVGRRVTLRLEAIGPHGVQLARACAVLGSGAPMDVACTLANLDSRAGEEAAAQLVAKDLLVAPTTTTFAHPIIRAAVVDQLPTAERLRLHAAAAGLLVEQGAPAEETARHVLAAGPVTEPWALPTLSRAGRRAIQIGSPTTAIRYLRRALELTTQETARGELLLDLGLAEAAAGEPTSLARFEAALTILDDPRARAKALAALGQTLYRYGRFADAADAFGRGEDLFRESDPDLARYFQGAFLCTGIHLPDVVVDVTARLERERVDLPAPRVEPTIAAAHALYRAIAVAPVSDAVALVHAALRDGALVRDGLGDDIAVHLATIALLWSGALRAAKSTADAGLADGRRRGAALALAEAASTRAQVMYALGDIEEAMRDAQTAIDGIAMGWRAMGPVAPGTLSLCHIERGELDEAEAILLGTSPDLSKQQSAAPNAWVCWAWCRLHLARFDGAKALSAALEAGELLTSHGIRSTMVPWRTLAATAATMIGDKDQAQELVDEELAVSTRFGLPIQVGQALRAQAAMQDRATSIDTLERAVDMLEGTDAWLELARALCDLGSAMRRAQRRSACREHLERAAEIAARCGATALERHALAELGSSAMHRQETIHGRCDALTPTELRIAEHASDGWTNKQIAERLGLTRATVTWHLRHIYAKLDVTSRDMLQERLDTYPHTAEQLGGAAER